jgi:hypothetical protein
LKSDDERQAMTCAQRESYAKWWGSWVDIQFRAECRRLGIDEAQALLAPLATIGVLQEQAKRA